VTSRPTPDELARAGVYDPNAPDAEERLALMLVVLERGGTIDDIARSTNLGELALDLQLRPRSDTTLAEVVHRAGLDWPRAERFVRAAGITCDPDERVTDGEAATVELLAAVSNSLLGDDATVQVARVAGYAMARVAEALVGAFRLQFELPRRSTGIAYVDVVKEYAAVADALLPGFVQTLDALLRRQIVAVADRMWSTDTDQTVVTLPRAVAFADLVGYSAAVASMSVRELTDVLVEFEERTADIVMRGNGQIVKTIGDEAMFVTEDPSDACRIATALVRAFDATPLPPVRVGIAMGDVVSVFGDVFGPDVNLAARLVGLAPPSGIVVSERVHAGCNAGLTFEALDPVALKGFPTPVTAYRLVTATVPR